MSENILDAIEARAHAARGPRFTGWHDGHFFIDGTCSKRIAGWILRGGAK